LFLVLPLRITCCGAESPQFIHHVTETIASYVSSEIRLNHRIRKYYSRTSL
jgi:hypothetical protein